MSQEPTPIIIDENTATETIKVFNEYSLRRITIEISPDGYDASRITLVAGIGKRKVEIDPLTGFKLNELGGEVEIFSGSLAGYRDMLSRAVTAQLLTEQEKSDIMTGQLAIYIATDEGFKRTLNLLIGLGDFQPRAIKKVIPAN